MNKLIFFYISALILTSCISVTPIDTNVQNVHKFFAAVKKGNVDKVDEYLNAGFSVDIRNNKEFGGKTALMVASKRMNSEMVEFLIKNGADVNAVDRYNNTAISEASKVNKKGKAKEIVSILIKNGAKINPIKIEEKKSHTKSPLINAIESGNSEVVQILLDNNADIYGQGKGRIYSSPLDIAIKNFNNKIAKKIMDKGACKDLKTAYSALYTAIKGGNIEIIKELIKSGVDPNYTPEDDIHPILAACLLDKPKILELMLKKGADLNYKDKDGNSLLHFASKYGKIKASEILLKNGIDINIRNDNGETPLMIANMQNIKMSSIVENIDFDMPPPNEPEEEKQKRLNKKLAKHLKTVERLDDTEMLKFLIKKGADVNAKDKEGKSVLMHMVSEGMIKSVEELIKNKADVNAKDKKGNSVLAYASGEPYKKIYDMLVKNGAELGENNKSDIALHDTNSPRLSMPALFASRAGKGRYGALKRYPEKERKRLERIQELQKELSKASANGDNEKIKTILKEEGIDINAKDYQSMCNTPLIYAVENNHPSTVKLLIEKGADVNKPRNYGITPLFAAVKTDNHEMVKLLLDNGACVFAFDDNSSSSDEYKDTPFIDTLMNSRDYKIAELLLEYGGDVNAEFDKESSLLATAAYALNSELIEFLLDNGATLDAEDDFTVSLINLVIGKYEKVDINVRNEAGLNLFHYAVMNGEIKIADELLKKGLDINSTLRNGNNALSLGFIDVVQNNDFSTVKWLIEKGINVSNCNNEGKSCIELVDDFIKEMNHKMRLYCETAELEKPFRKEIEKIEKYKRILRNAEKKNYLNP